MTQRTRAPRPARAARGRIGAGPTRAGTAHRAYTHGWSRDVVCHTRSMNRRLVSYAGAAAAGALVAGALARRRDFLLPGRVVLVTGGSRGLGLVLARELVACGARVAICARDADELDRARADLAGRGGEVLAVTCDITDPAQVDRLVARVCDQLGPIEMLVNNAGVIQVGPMKLMTIGDYEEAMATHFWGPLHLMMATLPGMLERGEGRIVNIASIGGKVAVPHLLPYTASKFALVGLSEGMRAELAKDNVYVTTVVPGLMRTGGPVNALFKGQHRAEYAWFAIGDSLHFTSIAAERAAHQILEAARRGRPEIILSPQAKLVTWLYGLAPGLAQRALALVDRLLPRPGGVGEARVRGRDSRSAITESILTRATDRAALRNNEM